MTLLTKWTCVLLCASAALHAASLETVALQLVGSGDQAKIAQAVEELSAKKAKCDAMAERAASCDDVDAALAILTQRGE